MVWLKMLAGAMCQQSMEAPELAIVLNTPQEILEVLAPIDQCRVLAIVIASPAFGNFHWWRFLVALSRTGRRGRFIRAYLWLSRPPSRPQWRAGLVPGTHRQVPAETRPIVVSDEEEQDDTWEQLFRWPAGVEED